MRVLVSALIEVGKDPQHPMDTEINSLNFGWNWPGEEPGIWLNIEETEVLWRGILRIWC